MGRFRSYQPLPQQQPQPPIVPQPGQPGFQYQPKKKKPNYTGLYVALGAGGLLIIALIVWSMQPADTPSAAPPEEKGFTASVNLSENTKREMYKSLCSLRGMLRSVGTSDRRFLIIADRYKISQDQARQVETEGASKRWPTE